MTKINRLILIFVQQVSELEHKVQYIEQFANETVEKYQEIANQQQSRQQIDELKEKNKQLKNVSSTEFPHTPD